MLDHQQSSLFTELTLSEEESLAGGWPSWSDIKKGVKKVGNFVKDHPVEAAMIAGGAVIVGSIVAEGGIVVAVGVAAA